MRANVKNKKEFDKAALKNQPEQFGTGRKCKRCGHTLTTFNAGPNCLSYCGGEMERYG